MEIASKAAEFDRTEFFNYGWEFGRIALIGITLASLMYLRAKLTHLQSRRKSNRSTSYRSTSGTLTIRYLRQGLRRVARQVMEVDFRVVDGAVNSFFRISNWRRLKYLETVAPNPTL